MVSARVSVWASAWVSSSSVFSSIAERSESSTFCFFFLLTDFMTSMSSS